MITVATISYNRRKYLKKCIESVSLSSSRVDEAVQYVVVDALSTDGSVEIIRQHPSISKAIIEEDDGPASGLNKAFSHASGEFGFFVNADDYVLPTTFQRVRRAWMRHPNADVILGGAWMVDGNGRLIRPLMARPVTISGLLNGSVPMIQLGMTFRLSMFKSVGGFNESNKTCWDLELLIDMMVAGAKVVVVSERFGVFRLHEGGLTGGAGGQTHQLRYLEEIKALRKKYINTSCDFSDPQDKPFDKKNDFLLSLYKLAYYPAWMSDNIRFY